MRSSQATHHLVEGFGRAPVLFLLVRGQLQRNHRDRQVKCRREPAWIVLDQLGGTRGTDHHCRRLEPLMGLAGSVLEQLRGIAAEVARLKGGVGDRRSLGQSLDHGEEQIGVGVALWRMQHVVDIFQRSRDPHRTHVRRAFVGPQCQLHVSAPGRPDGRVG